MAGLLMSILIQSRIAFRNSDPLVFLAIGVAIALAVLVVVTAINRSQTSRLITNGDGIDFMVRPFHAAGLSALYLLAFVGVIAVAFMLRGEAPIEFGSRLTSLPIWAIGFAIYQTSYVNSRK
jgi:hypothetical protein